ncbi:MAG: hypothetical protein ACKO6B_04725 [Planctomycetia bacterium]
MPGPPPPPSPVYRLLPTLWLCVLLLSASQAPAADVEEGFEEGRTRWMLADADSNPRVSVHGIARDAAHRGTAGERIVLDAAAGTTLRLHYPIGRASVIDEFRASVWVRANRPAIRIGVRIVLPNFVSAQTGRPVDVVVPGTASRHADRWELLEADDIRAGLERQLSALRAQHGRAGGLAGAVATDVVLELYSAPGRYDVSIDDLQVQGAVSASPRSRREAVAKDPAGRDGVVQAAFTEAADGPTSMPPVAALTRGVLEVGGLPFFPRSLDHNGEPLETIARLGFNCVRLAAPATADLLAEAQRADVWLISPPPQLPDIDVRSVDSLPSFSSRWDRVLFWDMGSGLAENDVADLAERVRRVRTCDSRGNRPTIAAADSGLRSVSRHVDMLVARRTVLGTSLELLDYLSWLRERPRLTRPGTPILAALATEMDQRTSQQAAALSGIGSQGLAVDPESLCLASLAAVSAGTRGILFSSQHRIDGDDHESKTRAAAALSMNLQMKILEPWGAAGRFAAAAQSSDPEVQAVVLEAARARMVVVWRCVQGSQIVARHYHGDIPRDAQPLTLLVPGVPEAHQAWEVSPGGLRPLRHKRVTGGISLTLDSFRAHTLVLLSGDPAVTSHVQERVRGIMPLELASARALAEQVLADDMNLIGRLPPRAMGHLPVAAMLAEARQDVLQAGAAAADPALAIERLRRAAAIAGQVERLAWERGVLATGSMVASPLSTSDATLAEHWRFIDALSATTPTAELLAGGGMERIEELSAAGWRHFALEQQSLRSAVEIDRSQPAMGGGSLVMRAEPTSAAEAPVVVETPPVWVTTPPVRAPAGRLLEIQARVWVPRPIKGSVDGLLVFDSLGGPALAERVGVTPSWRRLVLYRIVPADAAEEPLTVTFALTGMGEARIDDVSIRVLERGAGGIPATVVSTGPPASVEFPRPSDLLAAPEATPAPLPPDGARPPVGAGAPPKPAPPVVDATPPAEAASPPWPGMNLGWPKLLPFGQSPSAPPPGPGGGTIDPFKRARAAQP